MKIAIKPSSLVGLAFALAVAALACREAPKREARVQLLYVANAANNDVQVIDAASGETLRRIYAGVTPWRLVPSPDGRHLLVENWSSETTAVVDLASHEVTAVLPVRGPGVFDASGERFLSFGWPGSGLRGFDARSFEELEPQVTEVTRVYDLAVDGDDLLLLQHDPMSPETSDRYSYLVRYPLSAETAMPESLRTGIDPLQVLQIPGQPFVLSADSGTNGLTLLNDLGDGRAVPTCAAPRRILLAADASRMVVLCWYREASRESHLVSYRTDFSTRPWPTVTQEGELAVEGGLVAGAMVPAGDATSSDRVWVVDQPGRRLLEVELGPELAVRREVAVGDAPVAMALLEVPPAWRERAAQEGEARALVKTAVARLQGATAPFTTLTWGESIYGNEDVAAEEGDPAEGESEAAVESRRLEVALHAPARLRRHGAGERVSLAAGGWTETVASDGRFWTAPRQELVPLVYALANFELDEAVQRLAGDVAGSPELAGGLAVDVATEVEDENGRFLLIGALASGQGVSQLWIDTESGRATNVIEKLPIAPAIAHEGSPTGGLVETKLYDFTAYAGGVALPARLERSLDGRVLQEVRLADVEVDPELAPATFDLSRLGAFVEPGAAAMFAPQATTADDRPGRRVPIMEAGYLDHPWVPHLPYSSNPPTSGPRLRSLADWGVHPLPLPLSLQVHNLEHGGVAVQYNCPEGCPDVVDELVRILAPYDRVLIAPYPLMEARIALTAWGRIETMDEPDEGRIRAFVEAWEGIDHHGTDAAP